MQATPRLRRVSSDEDLEAWVQVRNVVVPNEPTSVEEMRVDEDGRLLLIAELEDVLVGCGITRRSAFAGRGSLAVRVLPAFRRRGIGTAVLLALCDHVRDLGRDELFFSVYADDPGSIAFADRFGKELDYRLELIRTVGVEEPALWPEGIEGVALDGRREELLRAAWPLALQGHDDMPLPGDVTIDLDDWLRNEATHPGGSFVALDRGEVVGYAGLLERADDPALAEHGLTVVRRDYRGRGIAYALKRAQLRWAAEAGIRRLVTWTQKGNEPMQALNRRLGYVDHARVLLYTGPLPPRE
jgi:mycothiol synthase